MIIDEIVEIKKTSSNLKYYVNLNYQPNSESKFLVNVNDLPKNSHVPIKVKCDLCGCEKTITYYSYRRNIENSDSNIYTCIKCSKIKYKNTNLIKYGKEYPIQNDNIKNKRKLNNILKYGVDETLKNKEVIEKIKKTRKEKYGDENYNNIIKIKDTKNNKYKDCNYNNRNKNIQTCLNKYKVKNVSQIDEVKNKKKSTYYLNYGVDNYSKSLEYKSKRLNFLLNKYNDLKIISFEKNNLTLQCDCGFDHSYDIDINILRNRIKYKTILCTVCSPVNSYSNSGNEIKLQNFIKDNYNGNITFNVRGIISPYELDIYIPDLKLAFEYNGLFWHSEINKNKNYHFIKTEECEKNGIRLIHIYEDDWLFKQEIVKSRILNLLGSSKKIYARKCEIKEINDNKIIRKFLDDNHIQSFIGSSIKIGLFYDNELVSIMTFGSLRKSMGKKNKNDSYELLRFCNKLNLIVVGGASKMFNYFIKKYKPIEVISYADRSWSKGNLYENIGFKFSHKTKPNYYYVIDNMRKHRFSFRKDKLIKDGADKNKTEHQIMLEKKIFRVYDSGHLKYVFNEHSHS
jgi:hypothetical protein